MVDPVPPDQNFLQWLTASVGAVVMAVIGHIYSAISRTNARITRTEDTEDQRHKDEAAHEQVAHDRLWSALNQTARDLGAAAMATGHYVGRKVVDGRAQLHRAIDPARDHPL